MIGNTAYMHHDMESCHESKYLNSCHESCHEKLLSKEDWFYLVRILEGWRVFNPRSVIKYYGALNCWEAMIRTKDFCPRVPGAYFTKTVRDISGKGKKNNQVVKINEPVKFQFSDDELFSDYKKASNFIVSLKDSDLKNPEIFAKFEAVKQRWNFG